MFGIDEIQRMNGKPMTNTKRQRWIEQARTVFDQFAAKHQYFTTEAARSCKAAARLPDPNDGRIWGAVARSAQADRVVTKVGTVQSVNPRIHRMHVALWRSNVAPKAKATKVR